MAGNVRGLLNVRLNPVLSWTRIQEEFVTLYNFFVQLADGGNGPVAIHASYFGNPAVTGDYTDTGTVGQGMAYWDAPNAAGEGAFFVVRYKSAGETGTSTTRTHSYYLLFQWTRASVGATGGGGSGYSLPAAALPLMWGSWESIAGDNNVGAHSVVGVTAALGDNAGSDLSPWAGTANHNGADTKGNPVWSNAATVVAFPRCNGPGGAHKTAREAVPALSFSLYSQNGGGGVPTRMHVVSDDDNLAIFQDWSDNGLHWTSLFGPYTPARGITVDVPFVMMMTRGRFSTYGSTNTTRYQAWQGGATQHDLTLGCRGIQNDAIWDGYLSATHQPTKQTSPSSFSCYPLQISTYEDAVCNGELGYIDSPVCCETSRCAPFEQDSGFTRIVLGHTVDVNSPKNLTVWDGVTVYGASYSREGTFFSVAP